MVVTFLAYVLGSIILIPYSVKRAASKTSLQNRIALKREATKSDSQGTCIDGVVIISFAMIVFISIGFLLYIHQIWSYKIVSGQACSPSDVIGEISLRSFSYNQLVVGTDDFKKAIGREGSGRVYKGCLGANNAGKEIAVKSLEKLVEDGENDKMKIIRIIQLKNLIPLVGFCSEESNRLLL
ncbi:hypothetical protein ACOSQ4_022436 [Xanthoceras sorbifolium]